MKKLGTIICAIVLIGALTGCVSSECNEPLLDYDGDGKTGASDYDIMKSAEQSCMEGY